MFVNKNAQSLINLLPDHNTEVKEVESKNNPNKKVFIGGLPTGVPRNIQKLFYTKGKRIGNNFQWNKNPASINSNYNSIYISEFFGNSGLVFSQRRIEKKDFSRI